MWRNILSFFLGCVVLLLVACTNHNTAYLKQSQTVEPIVAPSGVGLQPSQSFYPIPNVSKSSGPTPSMVPPGSNLDRFKPKTEPKPGKTTSMAEPKAFASLSQTADGQSVLRVPLKSSEAWSRVGQALRQTPYKVLDQDQSMSSYYVLDINATDGKITQTTPIYRVYLKADADQTEIAVLSQSNTPVNAEVSKRILSALQSRLVG